MSKLLIFNDTSRYQHYGCDLVMRSIFSNLRRRGHQPVSVHKVGTSAGKRFDAILRRHPDAQAIIVNGEGVIHHDRKHALGLAALAGRARQAGLPAYLINAALFDNSAALYRDLSRYDAVYVRDGESQAAALAHGIPAERVPDLSFDGVAAMSPRATTRSGVLITDSVHDAQSGQLAALARETDFLWHPMRRRVALPFAWMREAGAHRFVRRLRASEWVLTGRFHAVTFCIATGTPFLAMSSNTRKVEALLLDVFGNLRRLIPAVPSADALAAHAAHIAFDAEERAALDAYLRAGRITTAALFDRLSA